MSWIQPMLSMLLMCLATRIIDEAMPLAEHADLHVDCLKWPKTTESQAQPTWMVTFGCASDDDASQWNLFEPELICEANLSFADNTRSAMDFGSSGRVAHQWHPSQTSRRLLACTGSSSTAQDAAEDCCSRHQLREASRLRHQ